MTNQLPWTSAWGFGDRRIRQGPGRRASPGPFRLGGIRPWPEAWPTTPSWLRPGRRCNAVSQEFPHTPDMIGHATGHRGRTCAAGAL